MTDQPVSQPVDYSLMNQSINQPVNQSLNQSLRQLASRSASQSISQPMSPSTSQPAIALHIEELVLHGFARRDRDQIGVAVQQELTRLFTEQGVPRSLSHGGTIPSLDGGSLAATRTQSPTAIGHQIAQAIYDGLTAGSS